MTADLPPGAARMSAYADSVTAAGKYGEPPPSDPLRQAITGDPETRARLEAAAQAGWDDMPLSEVPGSLVGGYVVALAGSISGAEAEATLRAIEMIRGVVAVRAVAPDPIGDQIAVARRNAGLTEFDHVIIGYTTASGHRDATIEFCVDDYEKREASGDIDKYLTERDMPVLRRDWHPVFTEVSRWVGHKVLRGGEYVTV